MKARYMVLSIVVLAAILTASVASAEYTLDVSYKPTYTDYAIDAAVMVGSEIFVGASNTSSAEDSAIIVLDINLTVKEVYNITANADTIRAIDCRGDLIAVGAVYGNTTIFIINRTDGTILGPATIESGASGYAATVERIALSGEYVYALVYNDYDMNYYLYILDKTPSVVSSELVGVIGDLARVGNSDYLLYWNGSNLIYIADGSGGTLNIVGSIDVGSAFVTRVAGYYNSSENAVYVVYGSNMGVYLAKYVIGSGLEYNIKIGSESNVIPVFVAPTEDGLYIVAHGTRVAPTENWIYIEPYGYRVTNLASPAVEVEAIPAGAFGYYYGSEYVFALQEGEVRRYALEIVSVTTTQTVTKTTTETQVFTEVETETETETVTVQGPYTEMDLVLVGLVCLVLGAAIAYIARRR